MARAAQLRSDVLTVFPNTLLRFYGEDRGPLSRDTINMRYLLSQRDVASRETRLRFSV